MRFHTINLKKLGCSIASRWIWFSSALLAGTVGEQPAGTAAVLGRARAESAGAAGLGTGRTAVAVAGTVVAVLVRTAVVGTVAVFAAD